MSGRDGAKRPYRKLTEAERARFLAVLRETGNRKAASAAIGVEPRSMDQRRESDPELDQAWDAAVEAAHRRLAPAAGPFDPALTGGGAGMIKRGKNGRLQLVSPGEGRWSAAVEKIFLARLRESGCVRSAARAVGFNENTIWQRRRAWPGFAAEMEEMLEEAELALEFRLAAHASNVVAGVGAQGGANPGGSDGEAEGADTPSSRPLPEEKGSFDLEAAFRFLKWREEKRRGEKRRAPRAKPPSIEEVTEKIVRRVEAIKRHRRGSGPGEADAGEAGGAPGGAS